MRAIAGALVVFLVVAASAATNDPQLRTVAELMAAPPVGQTVRVFGYVVDLNICPPCPMGAMCKPCARESSIVICDRPDRSTPGASPPVLVIATPEPDRLARGTRYRFEIAVVDRTTQGVDARLVGFLRMAP